MWVAHKHNDIVWLIWILIHYFFANFWSSLCQLFVYIILQIKGYFVLWLVIICTFRCYVCKKKRIIGIGSIKYHIRYFCRPWIFFTFFHFRLSHKIFHISLFTIFYSGTHIPLNHFNSHLIIKVIYICRIRFPLTFSTHFALHFLKSVSGQCVTKFKGRMEYIIKT